MNLQKRKNKIMSIVSLIQFDLSYVDSVNDGCFNARSDKYDVSSYGKTIEDAIMKARIQAFATISENGLQWAKKRESAQISAP